MVRSNLSSLERCDWGCRLTFRLALCVLRSSTSQTKISDPVLVVIKYVKIYSECKLTDSLHALDMWLYHWS